MIPTHEQHRPSTWAEFLGNSKSVKACRYHAKRGIGGNAYFLSGASGIGKTTAARILANTLADPFYVYEFDSADQFDRAELKRLSDTMQLTALGKGGRVWIINEAHALKAPIIRQLLGVLERLPKHVAIIFTTTKEGQAMLFEDNIEEGPLLSRCTQIRLTNQGLSQPFAARFHEVALAEGFDVPIMKCKRLIQDVKNNLRDAYAWLGSPESMDYLTAELAA